MVAMLGASSLGAQPQVSIRATDSLATETRTQIGPVTLPGLGDGAITVSLSQRSSAEITVLYSVRGSAGTEDIAALPGKVTIPAGATSVVIPIVPVDDGAVERDETVEVTLLSGTGYTVGTAPPATVTIVDNDQSVSFRASATTIAEPSGPASTVTVARLGTLRGSMVVRLAYSGTATRGTDFSAPDSVVIPNGRDEITFSLAPRPDAAAEGQESVGVSATGLRVEGAGPLSIRIEDAGLTVTGPAAPVTEVDGAPMTFVLTRSGDVSQATTMTVLMAGTAIAGLDYVAPPSSVTFAAGQSSVTLALALRGDLLAEFAEQVQVFLAGGPLPSGFATATIAANGPLPTSVMVPTTMPFGTEVTGTIQLLQPAIAGTTVFVASSTPQLTLSAAAGAAFVQQATLPVPVGGTSVGFRARAGSGTGSLAVTLNAGANAPTVSTSVTLTVSGNVTHAVGTAVSIAAPVLDTASIASGSSRQGVVRLSAPLAGTSTFVQLVSTMPAVTVPPSVTLAADAVQVPFTLSASGVTTQQQGLVIATRNGVADTLSVRVLPPVAVASLTLPPQIASGNNASGIITLNQSAPAGGTAVQLVANSGHLQLPASVVVPEGVPSVTFTATVPAFGALANPVVQVSGSAGGATASSSVTLLAHSLSFGLTPAVRGGLPYPFSVRLNRPAPAGGLVASLASSSPNFPVPATVAFAAGDSVKDVTVATQGVSPGIAVVLTVTFGAFTAKNSVNLGPAQLSQVSYAPLSTNGPGEVVTATITLTGTAPASGLPVTIENLSSQLAAAPSVITIPANSSTAQFSVTTLPAVDKTPGPVTLRLRLPDGQELVRSFQAALGVRVSLFQVAPTTIAAGASVTATVTLIGPAPPGGKTFPVTVPVGATAVTVPASITVPSGLASTSFTVTTLPGTAGQVVVINVGGLTANLTITP